MMLVPTKGYLYNRNVKLGAAILYIVYLCAFFSSSFSSELQQDMGMGWGDLHVRACVHYTMIVLKVYFYLKSF